MNQFKKKRMVALLGLLAIVLIVGSWAYFSQESVIENPFDTGKYGTTTTEEFEPDTDWKPGVETKKLVTATNTGSTPVIVRARLDEKWTRKADADVDAGVTYKQSNHSTPAQAYDVYTVNQNSATDGLWALDGSIVAKNFSSDISSKWILADDGWYYLIENLEGGQSAEWLQSVTLKSDADMGLLETTKYVSTTDKTTTPNPEDWVWHVYTTPTMPVYVNASGTAVNKGDTGAEKVLMNKVETTYGKDGSGNNLLGYSQSHYILTVTVQTVQPTQDALDAVFGSGSTFAPPSGTSWELSGE